MMIDDVKSLIAFARARLDEDQAHAEHLDTASSGHDRPYNPDDPTDPRRVLGAIKAQRVALVHCQATVDGLEAAEGTVLAGAVRVRMGAYLSTLYALVTQWSNHPDYLREWAL